MNLELKYSIFVFNRNNNKQEQIKKNTIKIFRKEKNRLKQISTNILFGLLLLLLAPPTGSD